MKQHVFEDVKKEFYKYGGMSGDSAAETDAYFDKIHSYVKTLKALLDAMRTAFRKAFIAAFCG